MIDAPEQRTITCEHTIHTWGPDYCARRCSYIETHPTNKRTPWCTLFRQALPSGSYDALCRCSACLRSETLETE